MLRAVLSFIEIDSWLHFEYKHLNKLLRLLNMLGVSHSAMQSDEQKNICCRYCISALLVRAAQFSLAICRDLAAVPPSDRKSYLVQKLTFGDQDPEHVSSVIRATVAWVDKTLAQRGGTLPSQIELGRLFEAPPYADEFVGLVQRLLEKADEALCLPVTLEVTQFRGSQLEGFPRLAAAAQKGDELAALLKGFLVRTLSMPVELLGGVGQGLAATYGANGGTTQGAGQGGQLKLNESG